MQSLWDFLLRHVGVNLLGHPLLFTAPILTTVVLAGVGFSLVDVFVTRHVALKEAALYMAITLPGYVVVFALLKWLPIAARAPYNISEARFGFEFLRDMALCLIIGDFLSYWWHRLEHRSRPLFRHVHRVHHQVARPLSVWSGFYVHPVESACVFVTFYLYPFLAGVHPLVFAAYASLNTFVTMVTHCGYDIPGYPKWLFASAPMHEHHHERTKKAWNYCVLLTLSDRLFGTFKGEAPPPVKVNTLNRITDFSARQAHPVAGLGVPWR